jgi:5,5'-dehydrodivanillate O-demethylase
MGKLLRHYWFPIAGSAELSPGTVRPVTLLGEKLALYRALDGTLGLVAERCPHRGASLAYGLVENAGLRCPYHGWLFGADGACLQQPNEDEALGFRQKIQTNAYVVRELGGLVFAYLGPAPVPEPPGYDLLLDDGVDRRIRTSLIACNWLQITENGLDPIHIEWLHGHYANYRNGLVGAPPLYDVMPHEELAFDVTDLGIVKRRRLVGQSSDEEDWTVGQLVLFPAAVNISNRHYRSLQYRVPVDDTHTWHIWYEVRDGGGSEPGRTVVEEAPVYLPDGTFDLDSIEGQDAMAWVTQGPIADRTNEHLGAADRGVIVLRRLLQEQLAAVERGERPQWADFDGRRIDLPRRTSGKSILVDR